MTCKRMIALCAPLLMTGCMPKMTIEDMKAMAPQRPAELDRLNAFVGKWEVTSEMNFAFLNQPIQGGGTNEVHWAGDNWFLISDGVFDMGELGKMQGHETWTYDVHSKKYRSTWTDSMGSIGIGESRYDEASDTWYMKATAHSPYGTTTMNGHVTFLNPDTMEWSWNEYMMGGLIKTSSMTGTSKRRK